MKADPRRKTYRNQRLLMRLQRGDKVDYLAKLFHISRQRISAIAKRYNFDMRTRQYK